MKAFLIKKVRRLVKKDKIKTTKDFNKDFLNHNFKENDIKKALMGGVHFRDDELYPNPERYKSKFYVIYKIFLRHILIGYIIYKDYILLIHTSPAGNWEISQFKRQKKLLKKRIIGLFLLKNLHLHGAM